MSHVMKLGLFWKFEPFLPFFCYSLIQMFSRMITKSFSPHTFGQIIILKKLTYCYFWGHTLE